LQLKQLLDDDELGSVLCVECTNHGSMPGGWFVEPGLSGGGAVIDHTVHVIDLLRWFWGEEITEVYAEIGDSLVHPNLGIDDAGLLSFTLGNGVYGTLDTSWSRPPSYATWGDVKIEVIAEGGVAYADMSRQHVYVSSNAAGKMQWHAWGGNMDMGLIQDFVESIRLKRPPSITGKDGLQALEVALAAYRSAAARQPVAI
jgi:predicted dehydrogenase